MTHFCSGQPMHFCSGVDTGAAGDEAGILDTALGGGSDFMEGVSTGVSSCLCGGISRVNGGLPRGGG
jgi:hypothetical protein